MKTILAAITALWMAVAQANCPLLYPYHKEVQVANTVELCNSFFVVRFDPRTNKVNLLPTTNTPQRNHVVRLVGHYSTIISNTAKWLKSTFSFLIQLVGISNFSYLSYKHLRREVKRSLVQMVNFAMEFKIIENLFLPSYLRNSVTNSISFLHRIEKQVSLFIGRQKFYFQCQLHIANIQNNFLYQKIILNLFNFKGVSVSLTFHRA